VLCSPMTQRMASEMLDFPASVGAHNGGDLLAEIQDRLVGKGFKALNFQCLEVHKRSSFFLKLFMPLRCKGFEVFGVHATSLQFAKRIDQMV
jgi:hypothetical protein